MKGQGVGFYVGAILLAMSIIQLFSFRLSITNDIDAWRLTRIAMVQANLMASEHFNDDMGIVESLPATLKSDGYTVTAMLYDPELDQIIDGELWYELHLLEKGAPEEPEFNYLDGMRMPRTSIGYIKWEDLSYDFELAIYTLPVVYGNGNRFGVLIVLMSAQDEEAWQPEFQEIFENAKQLYLETWGELE